MKKFLSIFILSSILASNAISFLVIVPKAKAQIPGLPSQIPGLPSNVIISAYLPMALASQGITLQTAQTAVDTAIKKGLEVVLKIVLETLRKKLLDYFVDSIVKWIQGVDDKPAFVTDWRKFTNDVINDVVGTAAEELKLGFLCSPFEAKIRINLPQTGRPALPTCTLRQITGNIENFYNDFTSGGWIAFNEIIQPQNNEYGAYLITMEGLAQETYTKLKEKEQEVNQSEGGFLNTKRCKAWRYDEEYAKFYDLQNECIGGWETTTPGGTIAQRLQKALDVDIDHILSAQEFTVYVSAILDAAINRLFRAGADGLLGMLTKEAPEELGTQGPSNIGYECDKDIGACVMKVGATFTSKEECDKECSETSGVKWACDKGSYTCMISPYGTYSSEYDCVEKCRVGGGECNTEPELCNNLNVYVRGQKCDGMLSNCAVVGPNNPNPTCCDIFCSHMRDVMYPQVTALHSWDWDDSKDNGIISAICKYAGVPVQSECHCSISNMGGACFTGIPKSKCGNPLAGKYPEYDKGLLICKGEPPYCVSDTKEEPTCADCTNTNMYVRGRLGGAKTDACEDGVCPICSGTRYVNSRNGVCEAFCLHTKEFLWGKEGLPSEKQFTKQEIINKGFESLFTHLSKSIPNEGCYCQRPLTNSTFADGYICYDCIPVQGKNLEENESMDWEFSVCKGSAWCDANCSD
jgi:hypothetical protein